MDHPAERERERGRENKIDNSNGQRHMIESKDGSG